MSFACVGPWYEKRTSRERQGKDDRVGGGCPTDASFHPFSLYISSHLDVFVHISTNLSQRESNISNKPDHIGVGSTITRTPPPPLPLPLLPSSSPRVHIYPPRRLNIYFIDTNIQLSLVTDHVSSLLLRQGTCDLPSPLPLSPSPPLPIFPPSPPTTHHVVEDQARSLQTGRQGALPTARLAVRCRSMSALSIT